MRLRLLFLALFSLSTYLLFAQSDSATVVKDSVVKYKPRRVIVIDSAALAKANFTRDSLVWMFMKPDPNRKNIFLEQMLNKYIATDLTFLNPNKTLAKPSNYGEGKPLHKQRAWVLFVFVFLVAAYAAVKVAFKKQSEIIFQAFYDNRILNQLNKDGNVFSSWYFLFSYVIFSLLIGLFIYVFFQKIALSFIVDDFLLFLSISLSFGLFLGLKIIVIKILGFIFEFQRVASEYINVLFVTFFNISVVFIPLTVLMLLTIYQQNSLFLQVGLLFTGLIFALQFLRSLVQILSNYRLSKFYLILYLCAFEISPIIIIIKALNI